MCGHHERHLGAHRLAKRDALDPANPIGRMLDERQLEVGVHRRVAVTGKVLAAGGNAVVLQTANDRRTELRNAFSRFRQRTIADDRVLRIGVDVEDRGIVQRDAHGLQFGG